MPEDTMIDGDVWDRRKDESEPAYAAFLVYRELEPKDRSQTEVAKRLGKSKQLIARWSQRYAWPIRTAAFDRHKEHRWLEQTLHLRREVAERDLAIAGAMLGKVVMRLRTIDAERMSARECAEWVRVATQVARLALGEPTERHEHAGPGGGPIPIEALGPEERRVRLEQLTKEATRRLTLVQGGKSNDAATG